MERYGDCIVSADLIASAQQVDPDLVLYTSAAGESTQVTIPGAASAWVLARAQAQPDAPGWVRISADTWANLKRFAVCNCESGIAYTPEGTRITLSPEAMSATRRLLATLPDLLA